MSDETELSDEDKEFNFLTGDLPKEKPPKLSKEKESRGMDKHIETIREALESARTIAEKDIRLYTSLGNQVEPGEIKLLEKAKLRHAALVAALAELTQQPPAPQAMLTDEARIAALEYAVEQLGGGKKNEEESDLYGWLCDMLAEAQRPQ